MKTKKPNYKKGFNILMDYWDYLPEEDKEEIHKELERCNL